MLPLEQGGLCAPDMELYYYYAQAKLCHYWFHPVAFMSHVVVEGDCVHPVPLMVAVCGDPLKPTGEIQPANCTICAWAAGVPTISDYVIFTG